MRAGRVKIRSRMVVTRRVIDGGKAVASLACHFTGPHSPSKLDLERNEVFAKLIAIVLRGRQHIPVAEPLFDWAVEIRIASSQPAWQSRKLSPQRTQRFTEEIPGA